MRSLRTGLMSRILPGVVAVLLASGGLVFLQMRRGLRSQLDEGLADRARTFASMVFQEYPDPQDPDDPGGVVFDFKGSLEEEELGVLMRITCETGGELARSPGWPADEPGLAKTYGGPSGPTICDITLGGQPARLVQFVTRPSIDAEELARGPAPDSLVRIEVIGRLTESLRAEAMAAWALGSGALAASAGTAGAIWLGIKRGIKPVEQLSAELGNVGGTSGAKRMRWPDHPTELRPVVRAVDQLVDRVSAALERERRFIDSSAHELRTPIAELKALAEVATRWPDHDRVVRSIAEVGAIAEEMESLISSLLAVARGGAGSSTEPPERIPMLPLAGALARACEDTFRSRRIACSVEGDASGSWIGPRAAVAAIVRNLVENAAEHTVEGGAVRIRVTTGAGTCSLEVENGPTSLTPDMLEKMFEPFWREGQPQHGQRGRGVGLAIVDGLCSRLGVGRTVALSSDRWLRMTFCALRG